MVRHKKKPLIIMMVAVAAIVSMIGVCLALDTAGDGAGGTSATGGSRNGFSVLDSYNGANWAGIRYTIIDGDGEAASKSYDVYNYYDANCNVLLASDDISFEGYFRDKMSLTVGGNNVSDKKGYTASDAINKGFACKYSSLGATSSFPTDAAGLRKWNIEITNINAILGKIDCPGCKTSTSLISNGFVLIEEPIYVLEVKGQNYLMSVTEICKLGMNSTSGDWSNKTTPEGWWYVQRYTQSNWPNYAFVDSDGGMGTGSWFGGKLKTVKAIGANNGKYSFCYYKPFADLYGETGKFAYGYGAVIAYGKNAPPTITAGNIRLLYAYECSSSTARIANKTYDGISKDKYSSTLENYWTKNNSSENKWGSPQPGDKLTNLTITFDPVTKSGKSLDKNDKTYYLKQTAKMYKPGESEPIRSWTRNNGKVPASASNQDYKTWNIDFTTDVTVSSTITHYNVVVEQTQVDDKGNEVPNGGHNTKEFAIPVIPTFDLGTINRVYAFEGTNSPNIDNKDYDGYSTRKFEGNYETDMPNYWTYNDNSNNIYEYLMPDDTFKSATITFDSCKINNNSDLQSILNAIGGTFYLKQTATITDSSGNQKGNTYSRIVTITKSNPNAYKTWKLNIDDITVAKNTKYYNVAVTMTQVDKDGKTLKDTAGNPNTTSKDFTVPVIPRVIAVGNIEKVYAYETTGTPSLSNLNYDGYSTAKVSDPEKLTDYWVYNSDSHNKNGYPQSKDTIRGFTITFDKAQQNGHDIWNGTYFIKQTASIKDSAGNDWKTYTRIVPASKNSTGYTVWDLDLTTDIPVADDIHDYTVTVTQEQVAKATGGTVNGGGHNSEDFTIPVAPTLNRIRVDSNNILGTAASNNSTDDATKASAKLYYGQRLTDVSYRYSIDNKVKFTSDLADNVKAYSDKNSDASSELKMSAADDTKSATLHSALVKDAPYVIQTTDTTDGSLVFNMSTNWAPDATHTKLTSKKNLPVVYADVELADILLYRKDENGNYTKLVQSTETDKYGKEGYHLKVDEKILVKYVYKNHSDATIFVNGYKNDKGVIARDGSTNIIYKIDPKSSITVQGYTFTVPNQRTISIWGGVYLEGTTGNTDASVDSNPKYEKWTALSAAEAVKYESAKADDAARKNNEKTLTTVDVDMPLELVPLAQQTVTGLPDQYRERTTVVTSYKIYNHAQQGYPNLGDDGDDYLATVRFRVYVPDEEGSVTLKKSDGTQGKYKLLGKYECSPSCLDHTNEHNGTDNCSTVIVPGIKDIKGEADFSEAYNLIYFKWLVPEGLDKADVIIRADILDKGATSLKDKDGKDKTPVYYNLVQAEYATVPYTLAQTPDTEYEKSAPVGFRATTAKTQTNIVKGEDGKSRATDTAAWTQWTWDKSKSKPFQAQHYSVSLTSGKVTMTPSRAYSSKPTGDGSWAMRSGYGFTLSASIKSMLSGAASENGYEQAPRDSFTTAQYALALYPEFGYSDDVESNERGKSVGNVGQACTTLVTGEIQFDSLIIVQEPDKTMYKAGETFDPTGMIVYAVNNDGTHKVVYGYNEKNEFINEIEIWDGTNLRPGQDHVGIDYTVPETGKKVEIAQYITMEDPLVSLSVKSMPIKTIYEVGEDFDPTGMAIIATLTSGKFEEIQRYTILDGKNIAIDQKYVTVSYTRNGVTAEVKIPIVVGAPDSLTLRANDSWYSGSTPKSAIESISFVKDYSTTSSVTESWPADVANSGNVTCYVVDGTKLIIAGDGRGFIYANADSSNLFNGFTNVTKIDGLKFLECALTENMSHAFANMAKLKEVDAGILRTSQCTNMSSMFEGCTSLVSCGESKLNVTQVTQMSKMFKNCESLQVLDLSKWDTQKVSAMTAMFDGCKRLMEVHTGTGFAFKSDGTLPVPNSGTITPPSGYTCDGVWHDGVDGTVYSTPSDIPSNHETTYYAYKSQLTGIVIKTQPTQLRYKHYTDTVTKFKPDGMIVEAVYKDGHRTPIQRSVDGSSGYIFMSGTELKVGQTSLTIQYQESGQAPCTAEITGLEVLPAVQTLKVTGVDTNYYHGDTFTSFSDSKVKVVAVFNDGSEKVVSKDSKYIDWPTEPLSCKQQSVDITYHADPDDPKDYATVKITITVDRKLEFIKINNKPGVVINGETGEVSLSNTSSANILAHWTDNLGDNPTTESTGVKWEIEKTETQSSGELLVTIKATYTKGATKSDTITLPVDNGIKSLAFKNMTASFLSFKHADKFVLPAGVEVWATWNDGHTENVTSQMVWNTSNSKGTLTYGDTSVNGVYTDSKGHTKTIVVKVDVDKVLKSIAVTTPPSTTTYNHNDAFNKTGAVVTATWTHGATSNVTSDEKTKWTPTNVSSADWSSSYGTDAGWGVNLVKNGRARSNPTAGSLWTVTAGDPAKRYDADLGGGGYVFYGGTSSVSTMTQDIDISKYVDGRASSVTAYLTVSTGGYQAEGDNATVQYEFKNSSGTKLATYTLGGVTAADRGNVTKLIDEAQSVNIPSGATKVTVTVTMTKKAGDENNGYVSKVGFIMYGKNTKETVSYTYGGVTKTATVPIRVNRIPQSLSIVQNAQTTNYTHGDRFDPTSLIIKVTYTDGSSFNTRNFSLSNTMADYSNPKVTINYSEGNTTLKYDYPITVVKAPGSVTAPAAKAGLVYSGSSQTLINAGSSSTGTIQYKVGSGSYSTSLPTATNAGTYTVYYRVLGDANHNDVDERSITVTIAKAAGSVTAPTAKTGLVYNGSAKTLINAGSSTTGTIQYKVDSGSYSTSLPTAINAGAHTVYYKVVGDANHNDVAEKSISVSIAKAAGSVTAPTARSLTYNKSAQTLINAGSSSTGTIQYKLGSGSWGTSLPSATNAGDYTVYYRVVGNSNYNDVASQHFTVTIAKAAGSVTAPTAKTGLVYNGSARTLINAGSSSTGTIQYKRGSSGDWGTSLPTATSAGTYTVYYRVVGNSNYNDVASKYFTVTIAKATQDISVTYKNTKSATWTINGKDVSGRLLHSQEESIVSISGAKGDLSVSFKSGASSVVISDTSKTGCTLTAGKYSSGTHYATLTITFTDKNGNYNDYVYTRKIFVENHDTSGATDNNKTYHWKTCSVCGHAGTESSHTCTKRSDVTSGHGAQEVWVCSYKGCYGGYIMTKYEDDSWTTWYADMSPYY